MGIIYCYTNRTTGKKYIGQTLHPERRKSSHLHEATKRNSQYYFHKSIRKYGIEEFYYEILEETDQLDERENYYIEKLNTLWPNGYNQTLCRNNSELMRNAISEGRKKWWKNLSEDEKQKRTEYLGTIAKGCKHSEESKKKRSDSLKKYLAENPRPKRVWTTEMKKKQSELLKEKYKNGIGRWVK